MEYVQAFRTCISYTDCHPDPRNSTSTNSVSTTRSSTLSFDSAPSLRGSSISSKRESLMSLDNFDINEQIAIAETNTADPDSSRSQETNSVHSQPREAISALMSTSTTGTKSTTQVQPGKGSKRYFCTYCPADSRPGFVRRSDWKKHETFDHESGKLFFCAHSRDAQEPCRKWWYSAKSIQNHHAEIHQRQGCTRRCSAIRESRKTVFACGFTGCEAVFVDDPNHNKDAWNERCRHVADHFENPEADVSDWDYSTMFMNLLRQPLLLALWTQIFAECDREYGISTPHVYRWDHAATETVRGNLETASYKDKHRDLDPHQSATRFLREIHRLADHVPTDTEPAFEPAGPVLFDASQTHSDGFEHHTLNSGSYQDQLSPGFLTFLDSPSFNQVFAQPLQPARSPQQYPSTPPRISRQRQSSSTSCDAQQVMTNAFRGYEERFYDGI